MKSIRERGSLKFSELFEGVTSRTEVVVTFLALLELIRLKQLIVTQPEPFGEIEISRAPAPVLPSDQSATSEVSATSPDQADSESSSLAT